MRYLSTSPKNDLVCSTDRGICSIQPQERFWIQNGARQQLPSAMTHVASYPE